MSSHHDCSAEARVFQDPSVRSSHEITDEQFDRWLPQWMQRLSSTHWTPVPVACEAASWLVTQPKARILDVGCGPGKFCIIGASVSPGIFTGVEQRGRLAEIARQVAQQCELPNVRIIHGNVLDISFHDYDAFYLFNPFQENVFPNLMIDEEVSLEPRLYEEYQGYVKAQLAACAAGTKIVTFHGDEEDVPSCYSCHKADFDGKLKLWIKEC